jgi:hypothetical protein
MDCLGAIFADRPARFLALWRRHFSALPAFLHDSLPQVMAICRCGVAVNNAPQTLHVFCVSRGSLPCFLAWNRCCLSQSGQRLQSLPVFVTQSLPHFLQAIATPPV